MYEKVDTDRHLLQRFITRLQWNLSTVDLLYSGHLTIADTILGIQLLIYLIIADTFFYN